MLIEAPLEVIDEHVQLARDIMAQACRDVLGGKPCRTRVKAYYGWNFMAGISVNEKKVRYAQRYGAMRAKN